MSEELRAGVSRAIISPPPGIFLIGYGDRTKGNIGIHDDLTATALSMLEGETCLVLVALDLLCLNEFIVDRVRSAVGDDIQVILACSHTHSGPIGYAGPGSGWREQDYMDWLVRQITQAIHQAVEAASPASLTWSQSEAHIAVNRRERKPDGHIEIGENPAGAVDPSVQVLSVIARGGSRIATLVNFACHGTVWGPDNLKVSADWIGVMRSQVEQSLGGLALFLQGATGDLNPKMGWGREDCWNMAVEQGSQVAQAVAQAVGNSATPMQSSPLQVKRQEVWLPFREAATTPKPPTTYRKRILVMANMPGWLSFVTDPLLNIRYPWRSRIEAIQGHWATPLRVTTARIGELALVTYGAETFTEIGMQVKANSPSKYTLFASISDGCIGYLATRQAHTEGGYEVDLAPYAYRFPGSLDENGEILALETTQKGLKDLFIH